MAWCLLTSCRSSVKPTPSRIGALEHENLAGLLPVCEAQVMPSTFPEAFGMIGAEAAACGVLPLSARHSGMAEVAATLAPALPEELRPLLSFEIGPGAVEEIAAKLVAWLMLDDAERARGWRWQRRQHAAIAGKT
jgi:glycosyltransferase involved in cell wall biosynthesis